GRRAGRAGRPPAAAGVQASRRPASRRPGQRAARRPSAVLQRQRPCAEAAPRLGELVRSHLEPAPRSPRGPGHGARGEGGADREHESRQSRCRSRSEPSEGGGAVMTTAVKRPGSAIITFPTDTQMQIIREFDAPARLLFRAWTTPEYVKRWWGFP